MADASPNYSFITSSPETAKKRGLPPLDAKRVLMILGGVLIISLLIILLGSRSNTQPNMVAAAARANEIARVSDLVAQNSTDTNVDALASTVSSSLNSEQSAITSYLTSIHITPSTTALAADKNNSTDALVQSASQNNNLGQMYSAYLKTNLAKYLADLSAASAATGQKGRVIITSAANSTQAILSAPILRSSD